MILAAGITPAWQQIVELPALQIGEVNRAETVTWCASGKVLNVGIALSHLCTPVVPSRTLSIVGGLSGEAIKREFETNSWPAHWVTSQATTRVCTTLLDRESGRTTEIVENAGVMTGTELLEFYERYEADAALATVAVLSGSLPAGVSPKFYHDLLVNTACPAVLDIRGPELLLALEERPFLVKPNQEELARTLNRPLNSQQELLAGMREVNERGATWVVVSRGANSLLATSTEQQFEITPFPAEVVNPIGCGDSLAAGIAWGISEGYELPECLQIGTAAASVNLEQLLPARISRELVLERAQTIAIKELA